MRYYGTRFSLLCVIIELALTARAQKPWCVQDDGHLQECNMCWCLNQGVPVCTKMDCNQVPKEQWGKVKLATRKQQRSIILTTLGTGVVSLVTWVGGKVFWKVVEYVGGKIG